MPTRMRAKCSTCSPSLALIRPLLSRRSSNASTRVRSARSARSQHWAPWECNLSDVSAAASAFSKLVVEASGAAWLLTWQRTYTPSSDIQNQRSDCHVGLVGRAWGSFWAASRYGARPPGGGPVADTPTQRTSSAASSCAHSTIALSRTTAAADTLPL